MRTPDHVRLGTNVAAVSIHAAFSIIQHATLHSEEFLDIGIWLSMGNLYASGLTPSRNQT